MSRRALITGICGLVGSHLAERLVGAGWAVAGIDHRADDVALAALRGRIDFLHAPLSEASLAALPEPSAYDVIFHLAGRLGPAEVVDDPLTLLHEHAQHTEAVCELGVRSGAVVLLASSSEVYQWNGDAPMREDDALLVGPSHLPRCAYAVSKLHMEHIGLAYGRQRGVRVVVARLFNTVGPRQRAAFVLPILARQALRGLPLTVHGDGTQTRTFTHVVDAAEALAGLAAAPAAWGEVVNVAASGPCLTVGDAANRIAAYVAATYDVPGASTIAYVPYAATGDAAWQRMRVRRPDIAKLQRLTGLRFADRWEAIMRDVCADWASQLGVAPRAAGRKAVP